MLLTPVIAKGFVYPRAKSRASKSDTRGLASKSATYHKNPKARAFGFFICASRKRFADTFRLLKPEAGIKLALRIRLIVDRSGCEKVNIIAHSKGGLDCRYAISEFGLAPYVASLTTVNTPHRGCLFADKLLDAVPENIKNKVAKAYNVTLTALGDEEPDFLAAVSDLTADACKKRNELLDFPDGIYAQSIGSVMERPQKGQFPLNLSYRYVKNFDGENDGLVGESSFAWGEKYTLLRTEGKRGISHGDMIDLSRENISDFDVRAFYTDLVSDLCRRGL